MRMMLILLVALSAGCAALSGIETAAPEVDTSCTLEPVEWANATTPQVLIRRGERKALERIVINNEYLERHCNKDAPSD